MVDDQTIFNCIDFTMKNNNMTRFIISISLFFLLCSKIALALATTANPRTYSTQENGSSSPLLSGCHSPWQYYDNGTCRCGKIPYNILQCQPGKNLTVKSCYCVTFDQQSKLTEMGECVYNCGDIKKPILQDNVYITLPDTLCDIEEFLCGQDFNRRGTLCGECKPGFYPLVHSFDMNCIKCPNHKSNWWKFLLAAFLPITIFYFLVLVFGINITSSHLQGFVFCCQAIALPAMMRILILNSTTKPMYQNITRYAGFLYSIWNLDFFRSFKLNICLGTDTLQTLALDLVVGVYPLLLIILSYLLIRLYDNHCKLLIIIWQPFSRLLSVFRREWDIRTSLIDAFTTFFFLTNMKFLSVSFDLLVPVTVYQLNTTGHLLHETRLYYDASIPYFGKRHLPYALLAVAVLTVFVLLPTLVLFLYPSKCFQRLLNKFPFRWYVLHTFVDTFQGCYKDGVEPGTRDCRWFSCLYLLLRLVAITVGGFTLNLMFFPITSMLLVIAAILFVIVQPFKSNIAHHSYINATFLLLLALLYTSITGFQTAQFHQPSTRVPFLTVAALVYASIILYITIIIIKWIYSQSTHLFRKFHTWRHSI